MSVSSDDHSAEPAAPQGPGTGSRADTPGTSSRRLGMLGVSRPIWVLEHAQDVITVAVGIILMLLAAVLLVAGIVDFLDGSSGPISSAAPLLLDRVLLVLILVEIVHTVVLSLRAHRLVAQPFIVVGLVAVIRRILFVLTPSNEVKVSMSELALLIAMVAVFVAGLIAVSRFEKREE
ncbi:MAG: phosphate-starvation-inducible PsiE family protein [Micromonosporaceae bacterium]